MDNQEVLNLAYEFQKECQLFCNKLVERHEELTCQSATNIWIYKKLAELELRIKKIENEK